MTEIPAHLLRRAQAAREKAADEPLRQAGVEDLNELIKRSGIKNEISYPVQERPTIAPAGPKNNLVSTYESRARALDAAAVFVSGISGVHRTVVIEIAELFEEYLLGEYQE